MPRLTAMHGIAAPGAGCAAHDAPGERPIHVAFPHDERVALAGASFSATADATDLARVRAALALIPIQRHGAAPFADLPLESRRVGTRIGPG